MPVTLVNTSFIEFRLSCSNVSTALLNVSSNASILACKMTGESITVHELFGNRAEITSSANVFTNLVVDTVECSVLNHVIDPPPPPSSPLALSATFANVSTCNCSNVNVGVQLTCPSLTASFALLNSCINNISDNCWKTNVSLNGTTPSVQRTNASQTLIQNYLSLHGSSLQNLSTNFWADRQRFSLLNECMTNVSTNYWTSKLSIEQMQGNSACIQSLSRTLWNLSAMNWTTSLSSSYTSLTVHQSHTVYGNCNVCGTLSVNGPVNDLTVTSANNVSLTIFTLSSKSNNFYDNEWHTVPFGTLSDGAMSVSTGTYHVFMNLIYAMTPFTYKTFYLTTNSAKVSSSLTCTDLQAGDVFEFAEMCKPRDELQYGNPPMKKYVNRSCIVTVPDPPSPYYVRGMHKNLTTGSYTYYKTGTCVKWLKISD